MKHLKYGSLEDLQRIAEIRQQLADLVEEMASDISRAEAEGDKGSGKLGLTEEANDLHQLASTLRAGVFRVLILGDMKRGKSTFLNALLGEQLLPANVTRCTAILTIIRYGKEKTVTVFFNDGKEPEVLSLKDFHAHYTIQPEEAERLDEEGQKAFPDVSHAEITCPVPLLEKGIELIDSPGLNDTEDRNDLSLGFIKQSHAVLFIMSATQPITQTEMRYLDNYIKERNVAIFFIINRWDSIKTSLIDPDDEQLLRAKEAEVKWEFKRRLAGYCKVDGEDLTDKRIFAISALNALRQQLKGSLEDENFLNLSQSLNTFLVKERGSTEFKMGERLARQSYRRVYDSVNRRLSLIGSNTQELKAAIEHAKPEFEKFNKLRKDLQDDIHMLGDMKAIEIADAFRSHFLGLGDNFEEEFVKYQPKLDFIKFLQKNKRLEFERGLHEAFNRYINDQIASCNLMAEQKLRDVFGELNEKGRKYGKTFDQIADNISMKIGDELNSEIPEKPMDMEESPRWVTIMAGLGSVIMGDWVGGGMALSGGTFNWKNILANLGTVIATTAGIYAATGLFLGPIGIVLVAMGAGIWQTKLLQDKLISTLKQNLSGNLSNIANDLYRTVALKVKNTFREYEAEVIKQLDQDIQSRKEELDNLINNLDKVSFDLATEERRLKQLQSSTFQHLQQIEDIVAEMHPVVTAE